MIVATLLHFGVANDFLPARMIRGMVAIALSSHLRYSYGHVPHFPFRLVLLSAEDVLQSIAFLFKNCSNAR